MIRQMVICTTDHTDGDLHNDQTYFDILNLYMGTFRVGIKVKIKVRIEIIQHVCIHKLITLHSPLPF